MQKPNQNEILHVQHGLRMYFDEVCDHLSDVEHEFGSFAHYADIDKDADTKQYAKWAFSLLEPEARQLPQRQLNAFAFGYIAAQLCTCFNGELLIINRGQDDEQTNPQNLREILDTYLARTGEVYGLSQAFFETDNGRPTTELYMAGLAMLLADQSNLNRHEIEQQLAEMLGQ